MARGNVISLIPIQKILGNPSKFARGKGTFQVDTMILIKDQSKVLMQSTDGTVFRKFSKDDL